MRTIVIAAAFALCAPLAVRAQETTKELAPTEKPVRIESPTTVRLCGDCPTQSVELRVTVLDKAGTVTFENAPQVADVSTSGPTVSGLGSMVKAAWSDKPTGHPQVRMLTLTVDPPIHVPGTYEVVIDFNLKERPAAPRDTVKLTVPAAKLSGPEKLLVTRTVWWPFRITEDPMPLSVWETTRAAAVRNIRLDSLPFSADNEPVTGTLKLANQTPDGKEQPVGVAAGGRGEVPYRLDGSFPLGLASGKVRLEADETTEAVTVPVEIRSELSWVHLVAFIALGLYLSYLLKVRLQQRLQVHEARVAGATLLAQVTREREEFKLDTAFLSTTSTTTLETELAKKPNVKGLAQSIEKARLALDALWRTARGDIASRRATFRTRLDAWRKLTALPWDVPQAIGSLLNQARGTVAPAAALDAKGNVGDATKSLDTAEDTLATALLKEGHAWQTASRGFFDDLFSAKAGVSDAILGPLERASTAWRALAPTIPNLPAGDRTATPSLLRQITSEYMTARDHLRDLPRHLRRESDFVIAELKAANADPASIADIETKLQALEQTLQTAVDDPAKARTSLHGVLDALQKAWAAAFATARTSKANDVKAKVNARDYRGATELIGGARILSAGGAGGPEIVVAGGLGFRVAPDVPAGTVTTASASQTDPIQVLLLDAEQDVKNAKKFQTLIVGVMFLLWALTTSSATFDGTWHGLFVALFSAFGLDVGLDALRQRVTGKLFG